MYINRDGVEVSNPDPTSGLYVMSRGAGERVRVILPPGTANLAFQVGETSQIHTGGVLQATPHAVRGPRPSIAAARGVSRETMAVFMEPEHSGEMQLPTGKTVEDVQSGIAIRHLPRSVSSLASRWKVGQNFGDFSEATFSTFY
jgi:isopenicillin N synthase-like dioxygenase|eukprot:COSAG06_NODE_19159_length_851_cov_0.751330_2_plen_144_part_00